MPRRSNCRSGSVHLNTRRLSMSATLNRPVTLPAVALEPAAQAFANALAMAGGPPLYTLSPHDARMVLDEVQDGDVAMAPATVEEHTIPGGPGGKVSIMIVRP